VADRVVASRRDPGLVRLEGAHALKHALRFGADVEVVATDDLGGLLTLLDALAPDVRATVADRAVELDPIRWRQLVPRTLPSPAVAVARRPIVDVDEVLATSGRCLVLDRPRHLGNLGAAIRVAAAAGAGGVLVLGPRTPGTHGGPGRGGPAVRGPDGPGRRPAADDAADHRPRPGRHTPARAAAAGRCPAPGRHGTGRSRPDLRARADQHRSIEMRAGVSSLNLATAVAVALYAGR
jgi:RNA methyltransferase, TrmH family